MKSQRRISPLCKEKTRQKLFQNTVWKSIIALLITIFVLLVVFLAGRYGWKLGGFKVCESAGIESVEVTDGKVQITGFYPGSFPEGFLGYYAKEENGILYVGFQFSGLFGIFETGDFDISIPVKSEIKEVIIKTRNNEYSVWPQADSGASAVMEQNSKQELI